MHSSNDGGKPFDVRLFLLFLGDPESPMLMSNFHLASACCGGIFILRIFEGADTFLHLKSSDLGRSAPTTELRVL